MRSRRRSRCGSRYLQDLGEYDLVSFWVRLLSCHCRWDDWGSYINAMGTGYPAANPVRAVMEDAAGHASNSSGQTFGTHGARRMPP